MQDIIGHLRYRRFTSGHCFRIGWIKFNRAIIIANRLLKVAAQMLCSPAEIVCRPITRSDLDGSIKISDRLVQLPFVGIRGAAITINPGVRSEADPYSLIKISNGRIKIIRPKSVEPASY